MSIETGVLVNKQGEAIHWHLPAGRNVGYLPDSRDLWDVIWENRDNVLGFAHSHPGSGETGPSREDITTFSAVERALGRRLTWWITSEDRLAIVVWAGPDKHNYEVVQVPQVLSRTHLWPTWLDRLRQLSEYVRLDQRVAMAELTRLTEEYGGYDLLLRLSDRKTFQGE